MGTGRLRSLDVLRGLTVAAMILVNSPGSDDVFAPLRHSDWNGWTPTDLIFPAFLVMLGAAAVFARRGAAGALKRAAFLFGLGLLVNAVVYHGADGMRWPGVLQRIALCSLGVEAFLGTGASAAQGAALLLGGYAVVLAAAPLTPDAALPARLDRFLFDGHLLAGPADPEGLLGTLGALATALLGVEAGLAFSRRGPAAARDVGLAGLALAAAGAAWGSVLPLNKHLWTSSFALFSGGLSLAALAACSALVDRGAARWAVPFEALGRRALAAYVLAGFAYDLSEYLDVKGPLTLLLEAFLPERGASLAYALGLTGAALGAAVLARPVTRTGEPRSGRGERPSAPARSRRRSPSRPRTRRPAARTAA